MAISLGMLSPASFIFWYAPIATGSLTAKIASGIFFSVTVKKPLNHNHLVREIYHSVLSGCVEI
jgi:hypothetical protein